MWETRVWALGWEDPRRRGWLPTPVFLPGEFRGQRSLVGCSQMGCKDSDMTEQLAHKSEQSSLSFMESLVGTVKHLESEAEHFSLLPDSLKHSFFLRGRNELCQRPAVALQLPLLFPCKSSSFLKSLLAVPWHAGYRILVPCVCAQSCPTLRPSGLYPARLLCPWDFSRQE